MCYLQSVKVIVDYDLPTNPKKLINRLILDQMLLLHKYCITLKII